MAHQLGFVFYTSTFTALNQHPFGRVRLAEKADMANSEGKSTHDRASSLFSAVRQTPGMGNGTRWDAPMYQSGHHKNWT